MTQRGPFRSHGAGARLFALAALLAAGTAAWARVPTPVTHPRPAAKLAKLRRGTAQESAHVARPAAKSNAKPAARRAKPAAARSARKPVQPEMRHETHGPVMKRAAFEKTARPREMAAHTEHTPAAPKTVPAGGELTAEDFFRAAGAAPEPKTSEADAVTSAEASSAPAQSAGKAEKLEHGESHPVQDDRVVPPPMANVDLLAHPTHEEMADEAIEPVVLPGLYRNGRLVVPAPLKGSREVLVHQNLMADDEGLERIRDDYELARLRAAHELVNLPETANLRVNPELGADRRCARVWTVRFATDIARAFYARFHEPLEVNSAVRTVAYQVRLQRTNGNAAGVGGEVASPHLTGQAIDIGKHGMTVAEIAWMRAYLKPLMDAGKLDVEEEFQQACFHISVYKSYLPARRGVDVAQVKKPAVAVDAGR